MSKFPFYKQLDGMDCGPTCLRMIAKHYGKTFSVQQLRERSFIQRTGVNLLGISEAAAVELQYRYAHTEKCPFEGSKCTALRTHLFILPDGKVTICEQLYWNPRFIVGDVTKESIQEVWNSEKAMQLWNLDKRMLSSDSPCKECPVMEVCYSERNRCWADVIKAYGEEGWDYPDPRCEKAPELKNRLDYDS